MSGGRVGSINHCNEIDEARRMTYHFCKTTVTLGWLLVMMQYSFAGILMQTLE